MRGLARAVPAWSHCRSHGSFVPEGASAQARELAEMKYAEAEQRWVARRSDDEVELHVISLEGKAARSTNISSCDEDMEAQLALADAETRWRDARKKDCS